MKITLSLLLFLAILAVSLGGPILLRHGMSDGHNDCLASQLQDGFCPPVLDPLTSLAFHLNVLRPLWSGLLISFFALLAVGVWLVVDRRRHLVLTSLCLTSWRSPLFTWRLFAPQKIKTLAWLANHEESPN